MTIPPRKPSASAVAPTTKKSSSPVAVLIDGSALFLATKGPEERRLNYLALKDCLIRQVNGLHEAGHGSDSIWTMWTTADPGNAGQTKFLEFAEQRLGWSVRSTHPANAFMVEPEALFGVGDVQPRASRLIRFDASIAFAMGRLAETHRLVVLTDSFALGEPMLRINQNWGQMHGTSTLVFFGRTLDSRWRWLLKQEFAPKLVDLDDFEQELFGIEKKEVRLTLEQSGPFIF